MYCSSYSLQDACCFETVLDSGSESMATTAMMINRGDSNQSKCNYDIQMMLVVMTTIIMIVRITKQLC